MLYAFFWVIPRRLNCICRRFGTLSLLDKQVGTEYISYLSAYEDGTECSETSVYKIQTSGNYSEESVQANSQFFAILWNFLRRTSYVEDTFLRPAACPFAVCLSVCKTSGRSVIFLQNLVQEVFTESCWVLLFSARYISRGGLQKFRHSTCEFHEKPAWKSVYIVYVHFRENRWSKVVRFSQSKSRGHSIAYLCMIKG